MRATRSRYGQRGEPLAVGPQIGFAVATFAAFAAWTALIVAAPVDLATPVVASLFLCFAAAFALVALRRRGEDPARVTYADVAGALTLIGLFAAATIDPDQLVRLVDQDTAQP